MRGPSKKRLREDGTVPPPKRRKPAQGAEAGQNPDGTQVPDPYVGMQDPSVPPGYVVDHYEDPSHFGFQAPYPGQPYPSGPDGQHLGYSAMPPPPDGPPGPIDMNGAAYPGQPQYDPAVYGHPPTYPPQYQAYAYPPDGSVAFQQGPVSPGRAAGQERPPEASSSQPASAPNPANPPFLSREDFAVIMDRYLNSLSRKNREKALLTQAVYNDVLTLLKAGKAAEEFPDGTTTETDGNTVPVGDQHVDIDPSLDTPQFRFWVRKMFALQHMNDVEVVTHNGKPVAVQEQLYEILTHCHIQTNHGGRDKTAHMVNEHYSWIPKVFIETFVKSCPGCPRRFKKVEAAGSKSPHTLQVEAPVVPDESAPTEHVEIANAEPVTHIESGEVFQQVGVAPESEPAAHPTVQVKQERKGKSRAKAT
ncbi:uncharacterized protein EI90DRAFT_3079455 [Cantharellus anzutake]|uniref:uncharacterized protein n=1 Tax=Cantharellus anzutake TaxID=1750568 RepID=UPI001908EF08|nr:uncharacterized protein EI90DRAFT_3079455 [Cantharellus anzutake]KAF8321074.1 hypothetical protein EI90DRAFT_3079455 [Cantharellus anzutake]